MATGRLPSLGALTVLLICVGKLTCQGEDYEDEYNDYESPEGDYDDLYDDYPDPVDPNDPSLFGYDKDPTKFREEVEEGDPFQGQDYDLEYLKKKAERKRQYEEYRKQAEMQGQGGGGQGQPRGGRGRKSGRGHHRSPRHARQPPPPVPDHMMPPTTTTEGPTSPLFTDPPSTAPNRQAPNNANSSEEEERDACYQMPTQCLGDECVTCANSDPLALYSSVKDYGYDFEDKNASSRQHYALVAATLGLIHVQRVYGVPLLAYHFGRIFNRTTTKLRAEDYYVIALLAMKHKYNREAVAWFKTAERLYPLPGKRSREPTEKENKEMGEPDPAWKVYGALCRNDTRFAPRPRPRRRLRCRRQLKRWSYGFWKTEQLHVRPDILLFHDAITHNESQQLIDSSGELEYSQTVDDHGDTVIDSARISQTGWIQNETNITSLIDRRVEDMTGLRAAVTEERSPGENIQLNVYQPGGVYEPHYDVLGPASDMSSYLNGSGDRIATFMFYLRDVELGGATAFPFLNISVIPEKGSAVFWYNLHRNGSHDTRMLHGACPLIFGQKWAATKWIRANEQMTTRPCDLNANK